MDQIHSTPGFDAFSVPDLSGLFYTNVLEHLHQTLKPKTYLEVGVCNGASLALARCASVAIDPQFNIAGENCAGIFNKPQALFYQMGSDAFFAQHDPTAILGAPVDLAFLDGMHRCEFLLRDFMHAERFCRRNSVIVLHDCLPVDTGIVDRNPDAPRQVAQPHRGTWWAGDVWRTSLLLRRRRPDLHMLVLDSPPTGLVLITNLNPQDSTLDQNYRQHVDDMLSWDLSEIGVAALFRELEVYPTSILQSGEQLSRHFWL